MVAAQLPSPVFLDIKDRPGCITKEAMREMFEQAIRGTRCLSPTPLGAIEVNGEFHHYAVPNTDTMWLGFALGVRCAERVAKAKGAQS